MQALGNLLAAIVLGGLILFGLLWLWFLFEQQGRPSGYSQSQSGYSYQYQNGYQNQNGYQSGYDTGPGNGYGYDTGQPAYPYVRRVRRHVHHPCYIPCYTRSCYIPCYPR
jgi:hypothetical protein